MSLRGCCTTLAGVEPIGPATAELERQRQLARDGAVVERLLVTIDSARHLDSDVAQLLELDQGAGVRTQLLDASSALPPDFDLPLPLATWNGAFAHLGGHETTAPEEIALVESRLQGLREARPHDELVLPEPLSVLAPLARVAAPAVCAGCAAYHGFFEDLRLLDLAHAPRRFGLFFVDAIARVAAEGDDRVLIAGAADGNMLTLVLSAFARSGVEARVTMLDRCPTPLLLNRTLASLERKRIATVVSDVRNEEPPGEFGVIVTDSLLTLLTNQERSRVLRGWRNALGPRGRLVTVLRIEPGAAAAPERVDQEAADAFAALVRNAAETRAPLLDLRPDELASRARTYAGSVATMPVGSVAELERLLREAELEIEDLQMRRLEGLGGRAVGGPSARRPATYALVVARRR